MLDLDVAGYKLKAGIRAFNSWVVPYFLSRIRSSELRPILSYLYTDWKCNINCAYCWQFADKRPGMTRETAISSMDWLRSIGCRVVAIMGGEPLVRKDFILDIIRYGASKGHFMYLPTNGYLLDKEFIDKIGKAGVAAINLATDCIEPKPGLPKALMAVEPQFRYLVEKQEEYGYNLFLNVNITNKNIKDVKMLTEIAHDNEIAIDYHINEPPPQFVDVGHTKSTKDAQPISERDMLLVTPEHYEEVDALLDWLIGKAREGYTMVNSMSHLEAMKDMVREKPVKWDCRAGHNGILIRPDGSLSPCFDLITHDHDWGRIWKPKFDKEELRRVKSKCADNCLSTCFYTMGHYYHPNEILKWMLKHSGMGKAR